MVPKAGFEPARVSFYLVNGGIGIRTMLQAFTCPAHSLPYSKYPAISMRSLPGTR